MAVGSRSWRCASLYGRWIEARPLESLHDRHAMQRHVQAYTSRYVDARIAVNVTAD